MARSFLLLAALLGAQTLVLADLYMMNPRCSNNRLNEKSANRQNANRLFDSQNNNRGGYNVGDNGEQGFQNSGDGLNNNNGDTFDEDHFDKMYNPKKYDNNAAVANVQYNMMYTQGSIMRMTWTSQHGCGNGKNNCNMVIQYGCDTDDYAGTNFANLKNKALGTRMQIRNGGNTGTPNNPNTVNNIGATFAANNNAQRGRQESEEWYYYATKRQRNKGLFTADQNLKGNTQIYTRQNPNGNRRGLEVPEERDYYPYWGVSPWKDIAWLGNDQKYCAEKIAPESQNVKEKWTCVGKTGDQPNLDALPTDAQIVAQTETACTAANGAWVSVKNEGTKPLDCKTIPWAQVNNHGNTENTAKGGQMQEYVWAVPTIAQLEAQGCHIYNGDGNTHAIGGAFPKFARIVIRNRYNISTMDYDPYETNATSNQNLQKGQISPIQQNPTVDTGAHMQGLRLAINTAQTGRTFQDRSHALTVIEQQNAPAGQTAEFNMLNVNVRGKRGNIVQTYPAVEYDFEPNDFEMERGQCVHFQWTGSNTHNNGNPAGDGQAGDAGEGTGGTDRSNIAELRSLRTSYPVPYDKAEDTFFDNSECHWCLDGTTKIPPEDAKIIAASAGYYSDQEAIGKKNNLNVLLNNAAASFRQGMCCCATKEGVYNLVSTRNNNFTNRSQKLHIKVNPKTAKANKDKWEFFPAKESWSNKPSNKIISK